MPFDGHQNVGGATVATSLTAVIGGYGEEEEKKELDLRSLYKIADSHNFFCPNCRTCVTKVIILRDVRDLKTPPPSPPPPPIKDLSGGQREMPVEIPIDRPVIGQGAAVQTSEPTTGEEGDTILCGNCFSFLSPVGAWISSRLGFGAKKTEIPPHIGIASSSGIQHEPAEIPGGGSIAVTIPSCGAGDETAEDRRQSGGRKVEVIKSIVYGGLIESITSLGIVTSAASAKTPTENIVALALANLVTGLIVIVNHLSALKSNEPKKESNEETEAAQVDQYEETLGDRQHYLLHYTLSILSFFVFGLLPPLVYGFSFRDTDDADLKLAATAVSSLLCIVLLAIGKAYIQKPHKWQEFVKTVVYYITLGFGASGLSYLAGKEFDILLEQLGWFKRNDSTPTLSLPNVGFANPKWGSF